MAFKKLLRYYNLDVEKYNEILRVFKDHIKYVDDIQNYYYGTVDKGTIYVSKDHKHMVCRELYLYYIMGYDLDGISLWKQCRIKRVVTMDENSISTNVSGMFAFNYMRKVLLNYYTEDELEECMAAHTASYDEIKKQQHYNEYVDTDAIYRFDNCVEYDINSAHADALREIFPRASAEIEKMYVERKTKPVYKQIFNYFVGMLGSFNKDNGKHRGTYIWIVQRTTALLTQRIEAVGGRVLYMNTDGFVVQNPKKYIEGSKKIGDFKIEYEGPIYIGRTDHYTIMQLGTTLKGTAPLCCRKDIDLSKGQMVDYDSSEKVREDGIYRIIHKEIKYGK